MSNAPYKALRHAKLPARANRDGNAVRSDNFPIAEKLTAVVRHRVRPLAPVNPMVQRSDEESLSDGNRDTANPVANVCISPLKNLSTTTFATEESLETEHAFVSST